jgi:cyanophycin synthetase
MTDLCDGEVIFFARDAKLPVVEEHLKRGGRAVVIAVGSLVLATGSAQVPVARLAAIKMLEGVAPEDQKIEHILAAVAAGWALGILPELMRAGVKNFNVDALTAERTDV